MKKIDRMLRVHPGVASQLLQGQKEFSSGFVEGLRKIPRLLDLRMTELALYQALGRLPESELTHEFDLRIKKRKAWKLALGRYLVRL